MRTNGNKANSSAKPLQIQTTIRRQNIVFETRLRIRHDIQISSSSVSYTGLYEKGQRWKREQRARLNLKKITLVPASIPFIGISFYRFAFNGF
ncbi:hypothetical protein V1477_010636 [Vespula maculifrons]|uniref:Uncharacterized protein n=1 Tax=Vespula maculifrons TaxID=7453 RepID=A0ABD2C2I1_VESMC